MHTATNFSRFQRTAVLVVLPLLTSFASSEAFGQQNDAEATGTIANQIQQLVPDLKAREVSLGELRQKVEGNPDLAASSMLEQELSQRRAEYRGDLAELVDLVVQGTDAGADVEEGHIAATELLQRDAKSLRRDMDKGGIRNRKLFELTEKGSAEEASKARAELFEAIPRQDRLYEYFDANLSQRKQLGLKVDAAAAKFAKRLQLRADVAAGTLRDTKDKIDEIAGLPGVDKDASAQRELAALRKQRDVLADSQRLKVRLMDQYGLETSDLRREIIVATGRVSQDILDKKVAAGLVETWFDNAMEWLRANGPAFVFQMLAFVVILLVFWLLARIARRAVSRGLDRSKLKVSSLAKDFFVKLVSRLVMLLGLIIAVAQLGVETGPLLAGLGIAGFIFGFALQDSLSNFASGLMILVYTPFDVGDAIEAAGVSGKVEQMNLVSTIILTWDNQLLVVPNKQVWGGIIRNINRLDKRRVDMTFGIGYADDIPKAETLLSEIVTGHDKVLEDPAPFVRLNQLGESSVDFVVRPWAKTLDYWDVYFDVTREVKRRFDEEGISIPFPQRDVHIYHESREA